MATTTTHQVTTPITERKPSNTKLTHIGAPPPEPEHLPCPRCDSTNTKFCYYNNYNFSQPRHFCKSCRRYWTHGGTLRDIPIGGGTRKNAKRSRNHNINNTNTNNQAIVSANSAVFAVPSNHGVVGEFHHHHHVNVNGSFTSLLSSNGGHNNGFLGLGGFGPGIDDLGFGLGRSVWPFHGMVENGGTWQMENGQQVHHGFVSVNGNGECFTLPDLAISTPGTAMLK